MRILPFESLSDKQQKEAYALWDLFLNKLMSMDFYEVLIVDGLIVGISAIDNPVYVQKLSFHCVVCRNHRRKGYGKLLCERTIDELVAFSEIYQKEIELDVISNEGMALAESFKLPVKDRRR